MVTFEPVAIVGMAGRFPGADDIDEFRAMLTDGRTHLTSLTDAELLALGETERRLANPDYVRLRPRLAGADTFDAQLFGMTPREAELRDPQYRLFLESVHAALTHAGYDPFDCPGQVGVFAGTDVNRYRFDNIERNPDVFNSTGHLGVSIANAPDYLCTFVSYKLGLNGPSATVLTACSASLVAVHLACTAIQSGDCDLALAGGVYVEFPFNRGYVPAPGGIMAVDGVPRPFDQHATGTNFGNGVGVVALKPLDAALADGDTVYAVIRGSAINNDGERKVGFAAPSVAGQSECVQLALRRSGIDPRTISYVEMHGTATPVGDPIELAGLIDAFRAVGGELPRQYCRIGSVKSNIGHLGQAAGVAGLIKTAQALHHESLPASTNITTPNTAVDWETSPFRVVTETTPWPRDDAAQRRAGVSSFGIGGTNAHVVLEEAPTTPRRRAERPHEVVLWSGVDEQAADQSRERLTAYFQGLPEERFADAAHTLRVGRTPYPVRGGVIATDARDAAAALADPSRILTADGVHRPIAFGFPGQGAQFPGMLYDLYQDNPLFREGCDAAFDVLDPLLDRDMRTLWTDADADGLNETAVAQPLLYALELTLAHCLMRWGVTPSLLFGHSLGELAAASVAGVFDFESGLRAVAARSRLMQQMPRGRMLAVTAGEAELADLLGDLDSAVGLAAQNGPNEVVLSGPSEAIDALTAALTARAIHFRALRTSHAFHSPAMRDAAAAFEAELAGLTLRQPEFTVISAVTGAPLTDEEATSAAFWANQLVEPVRFDTAAATVFGSGPVTVVEVGPGRTLSALLRARTDLRASGSAMLPVAPARRTGPVSSTLEQTLAQLWIDGTPITYWHDTGHRGYRRIAAPGYPYRRRRYWVETQDNAQEKAAQPDAGSRPSASAEDSAPASRWSAGRVEWVLDREGRGPAPTVSPARSVAVLLTSPEPGHEARAAFGLAGYRTVAVPEGSDGFSSTDPAHWSALFDRLAADGTEPDVVAHCALLEAGRTVATNPVELGEQLDASAHSLQACLRSVATLARRNRKPVTVLVLGRHQVDVTGAEPVNAAAASVQALLRSAERELAGVRTVCVDVSESTGVDALARELAGLTDPLVALRGGARWLPRLVPLPSTGANAQSRLRSRGTYLITGGVSGIGLVVARALADTGLRPRLGLISRSGVSGTDPHTRHVRAELAAMTAMGADVEVIQADVTALPSLRSAVDKLEDRFGTVHGVVHSAGLAGGGLVERRDRADTERVLAPKTLGLLNLETVFAERPDLDFLVLFSSTAALAGLYGSADYAAANAFMDGYARSVSDRDRLTLSVQWPGWAEVGMAARSPVALDMLAPRNGQRPQAGTDEPRPSFARVYRPGQDWELEHVVDGHPLVVGVALAELALIAARHNELYPHNSSVQLRDTVFLAPLAGDQPVEVRVLLTPSADTHRFCVQSRPEGHTGSWTDHANGVIAPGPDAAGGGGAPAELLDRMATPRHRLLAPWIQFGERWNCLSAASEFGEQRVARLELAEQFHGDLAGHPMHPAICDVASQLIGDTEPGRRFAPFLIRRLVLHSPVSADVIVHTRYSTGKRPRPLDFDLYDTSTGSHLLSVEGFTVREIRDNAAFGPQTKPPSQHTGLLRPAEGAEAFMTLLAGDVPPVVVVNPPGQRLDVPGMAWADQPPRPSPQAASPAPVPPVQPAPATKGDAQNDTGAGDEDALTAAVRGFWTAALGITDIGPDDDFFDLGGNSLSAVQVVARIKERFGADLGAGAMFELNTIRLLTDQLRG